MSLSFSMTIIFASFPGGQVHSILWKSETILHYGFGVVSIYENVTMFQYHEDSVVHYWTNCLTLLGGNPDSTVEWGLSRKFKYTLRNEYLENVIIHTRPKGMYIIFCNKKLVAYYFQVSTWLLIINKLTAITAGSLRNNVLSLSRHTFTWWLDCPSVYH